MFDWNKGFILNFCFVYSKDIEVVLCCFINGKMPNFFVFVVMCIFLQDFC
jgi:hypothetical protein